MLRLGQQRAGRRRAVHVDRQARGDNYAAGFLRRRARAVIADGHMGAAYYLRALFTTNQSVLSLWRNAPNYNGNEFSFAATRNAGAPCLHGPGLPAGTSTARSS